MEISLKWVNELVKIEGVNLNDLINKLTLGGFEVEEIIEIELEKKKEITLNVSATANRSDSLSIQGFSLEIAALLNKAPKILNYSRKVFNWLPQIKRLPQTLLTNNDCSGFLALTIENINNVEPPKWLKQKLICSALVPENNLLDFQKYILLETGYPFEFYDLDKILLQLDSSHFTLNLLPAQDRTRFPASNGIDYKIDDSILILKADTLPISIAGVIPSKESCYSTNTTSLLIEGSIFTPGKIRQQSRILGLRTDRSSRYEKSLKNTNLLEAFYRLICLLRITNPNLVCRLHTITQPVSEKVRVISLDYQNINKVLGPVKKTKTNEYQYISPDIITSILESLRFQVNYNQTTHFWDVIVPETRSNDIVREIDLIEEIGRLYGFNKFLTRLSSIKKIGNEDSHYQIRKKLTSCLINLGLNELVQYSLVNEKTYIKNDVELINPLVKEYSNLRSSLLPNLLKVVDENVKKGNSILEGFEYGHVFSINNLNTIQEKEYIAGIFGGFKMKSNWSECSKSLTWFEAKGRIEQIFTQLSIKNYWQRYSPVKEKDLLHPYRSAELYLMDDSKLGIFGQIHPLITKQLNIPSDLYLFEFNFELIQKQIQEKNLAVYREYSPYPKIIKNLSFIIPNDISFKTLEEILYLNGSRFLTKINLSNEYKGESIPDQHTSLCLQLTFQSENQTLQNKEVESIVENLKQLLTVKFNAIIRI